MKHIALISGITFQEGLRNRILASILFFAVVVFALNFILADSFNFDLSKVAVDISMSAISVCSLLVVFVLCISQLSRDIDRRIVFMFLARPMARHEYILGKFFGFASLLLAVELLLGAGGGLSVYVITLLKPAYIAGHFNWPTFFLALAFHLLGCLIVLATAIFFAIFASSQLLAVLFTLGIYFAGHYLEKVIVVLQQQMILGEHGTTLTWALHIVSWLLPNLAAFDLKQQAAYGLPLDPSLIGWTVLYGLVYSGLFLTAAILHFNRKELS